MKIVQKCKHCKEKTTVDSNLIGSTIVCPNCKEKITVKIKKNKKQHNEWKVTTGPRSHHVTVEQTSKDLKAGVLVASLGIIMGILIMFANPQFGLVIAIISVVVMIFFKIAIWWNHG